MSLGSEHGPRRNQPKLIFRNHLNGWSGINKPKCVFRATKMLQTNFYEIFIFNSEFLLPYPLTDVFSQAQWKTGYSYNFAPLAEMLKIL